MEDKTNTLVILSAVFMVILLFLFGATITGYATMPVEYEDLCRDDSDCRYGKTCCISYEKEDIGLCMKNCQNVQFICSTDHDCEQGTVCCKSKGSLGICNKPEKCMDSPVLNKQLYDKIKKLEPLLESPASLTAEQYKDIYAIAILVELAVIAILAFFLLQLLRKRKLFKKEDKGSDKKKTVKNKKKK